MVLFLKEVINVLILENLILLFVFNKIKGVFLNCFFKIFKGFKEEVLFNFKRFLVIVLVVYCMCIWVFFKRLFFV